MPMVIVGVLLLVAHLADFGPFGTWPWWAIGLGMILGGALGNLVDRFFRSPGPLRGHVIDFRIVDAAQQHGLVEQLDAAVAKCGQGKINVVIEFIGMVGMQHYCDRPRQPAQPLQQWGVDPFRKHHGQSGMDAQALQVMQKQPLPSSRAWPRSIAWWRWPTSDLMWALGRS